MCTGSTMCLMQRCDVALAISLSASHLQFCNSGNQFVGVFSPAEYRSKSSPPRSLPSTPLSQRESKVKEELCATGSMSDPDSSPGSFYWSLFTPRRRSTPKCIVLPDIPVTTASRDVDCSLPTRRSPHKTPLDHVQYKQHVPTAKCSKPRPTTVASIVSSPPYPANNLPSTRTQIPHDYIVIISIVNFLPIKLLDGWLKSY